MKISDTIRQIETKFKVDQIRYKDLALWLDIRNRFFFQNVYRKRI